MNTQVTTDVSGIANHEATERISLAVCLHDLMREWRDFGGPYAECAERLGRVLAYHAPQGAQPEAVDDDTAYRIARCLSDRNAAMTGNNADDVWKLYSGDFYDDAYAVLAAITPEQPR